VKFSIFDDRQYPRHQRGVTPIPGLYFIGLPWLFTSGSRRFSGVGRDARYLVSWIAELASAEFQQKEQTG
jgi:putative flavoprotein involved in K+ transport